MTALQNEIDFLEKLLASFEPYRKRLEDGTLNFEPPAFLCFEIEAALAFRLASVKERLAAELAEAERATEQHDGLPF